MSFTVVKIEDNLNVVAMNRPSQIACTVKTVRVTCTQKKLHAHENSCTVLISLCKNNLNLSKCSSFFPHVLASFLPLFIVLSCLLPRCTTLIFLFLCFYRSQFCSPAINHISLTPGFHSSYFANGKNIIEQIRWAYVKIIPTWFQNYTNIYIHISTCFSLKSQNKP